MGRNLKRHKLHNLIYFAIYRGTMEGNLPYNNMTFINKSTVFEHFSNAFSSSCSRLVPPFVSFPLIEPDPFAFGPVLSDACLLY